MDLKKGELMKKSLTSYTKLFIIYFLLTTPFILGTSFAALPEAIVIQPTMSMRFFFIFMALGVAWIFFKIVDPMYKGYKFKTTLLIISVLSSTLFIALFLSY